MFYNQIDDIEYVSEQGDCPVCGASNYACKGNSQFEGTIAMAPPKGNDPLATFIVPHRIYVTVQDGSKTFRKLLHAKGAKIRPEDARA